MPLCASHQVLMSATVRGGEATCINMDCNMQNRGGGIPMRLFTCEPVAASHARTDLSDDADMILSPSLLQCSSTTAF